MLTHDWIQVRNLIILYRMEVTSPHFQVAPQSSLRHVSLRVRDLTTKWSHTDVRSPVIFVSWKFDRQITYWINELNNFYGLGDLSLQIVRE